MLVFKIIKNLQCILKFLESVALSASAADGEFCEWVWVRIDVYIPHRKYHIKPYSSPWFSAASVAAIVHRNHFFHLYQQIKSSESKVKFRQTSNICVFSVLNTLSEYKYCYISKNVTSYIFLLVFKIIKNLQCILKFLESVALSASAAGGEFCEWVWVRIDVYIPHRKYHIKPYSSPWFSAASVAAIVHRNHFFHLYQQIKSSESKVKFRQTSNRCERLLEAAKLAYTTKTKESITSQKLDSWDFWQIANSVLNKGKSAIPPLFNCPEVLSSAFDKANLFGKNFSNNSNLDDSGISLLFSLLELI